MKQVPLPPKRRPVVGIALGAGVARGWTHIGVLRTLRKAGIEPDIISGTSIGALVGGCEAAGKLDVLEEFARSLTRRRMLSLLDFRFRSSGLIGDAKLREIMHTHLADLNIEDMERRFVGVATELTTGHELWLHEGGLIDSIRASYALPGVFSPVSVDGRWLIDGALVNPVPVSVARALGAHVVIAVNLNNDPFDPSGRARHVGRQPEPYYRSPEEARSDDQLLEELEEELEEEERAKGLRRNGEGEPDSMSERIYDMLFGWSRKNNEEMELMKKVVGRESPREPGIASVMLASLNIVTDRVGRMRMASDPPDVMIAPRVAHLSLLDFDHADELIARGEQAAEEALPLIRESIEMAR